jgi:hypothetical protein
MKIARALQSPHPIFSEAIEMANGCLANQLRNKSAGITPERLATARHQSVLLIFC